MSRVVEKICALFEALTVDQVRELPPATRQKFHEVCKHWAGISESKPQVPPGILGELKEGHRSGMTF